MITSRASAAAAAGDAPDADTTPLARQALHHPCAVVPWNYFQSVLPKRCQSRSGGDRDHRCANPSAGRSVLAVAAGALRVVVLPFLSILVPLYGGTCTRAERERHARNCFALPPAGAPPCRHLSFLFPCPTTRSLLVSLNPATPLDAEEEFVLAAVVSPSRHGASTAGRARKHHAGLDLSGVRCGKGLGGTGCMPRGLTSWRRCSSIGALRWAPDCFPITIRRPEAGPALRSNTCSRRLP